ncbi:MAG: DUF5658 family protein [Planctomycetota bacterium]
MARTHLPEQDRPIRVMALAVCLWVLAAADLHLTLWAETYTVFVELNPLAALMLDRDAIELLVAFKVTATLLGTGIFMWFRTDHRGEIAAWFGFAVYFGLAVHWSNYTYLATGIH